MLGDMGRNMTSTQPEGRARFGWANVPRVTVVDLVAMLWAERVVVLSVGAAICALGLIAFAVAPKSYTARAELLVRMGEEYVYQPTAGAAGAGATPDMQAVVNAEMRMMGSGVVVRSAIAHVGLERIYPDIAHAPGSDARKVAAAERAFAEHLSIETAPQTPAIGLSFEHKDPEVAAAALNALVDAYLTHRREVLVGGEFDSLSQQSADLNTRVGAASQTLAQFLTENQIGDFDSEMAGLAARSADIETQLLDAQAKRGEAEARAASLRARYQGEPEEIQLYSESDARRDLVQAQMQRQALLSRYNEDALPVRELDRRIQQLQTFLESGDPASLTRRGANPVRQDLASQMYAMQAEASAQRGREAALLRQREDVRARLTHMRSIEPRFRELARQRTILETSAQAFAARAEESRARSQMLGRSTDNISQVEHAAPPTQGKSLRMPIALVTILLAGLLSVAAGLSRAFMRKSFPTPSSAARTLDTPVLGVVPQAPPKKPPPQPKPHAAAKPAKTEKPKLTVVEGAK